ncbi:MAG: metal-dependent hydrolase [Candidatus Kariarchaeaceae archaeon]|jgi:L-ascorbate metabolism protein UlaG (beta-lactamase superfamily)
MSVKVTWLGHACVQLEYKGKVVLIDPWISNPKFPGDDYNPKKIDLMLITHGHNDHFGEAIQLAKEHKPTIPVIHEMSLYLIKNGCENVVGMNIGGTFEHLGIKISMVPSTHSGGYQDGDDVHYLGTSIGYVVEFPDGNIFYHCGDTGATQEMIITRDLFCPNIGILAIGGHYTMDPVGAAYAGKLMGLTDIAPVHWGTFVPPLAGTPDELENEITKDGSGIVVHNWKPGDTVTFKPKKEEETHDFQ